MFFSFSIVVPIYNESENIPKLVSEIQKSLLKFNNYELILVDDCSFDDSKNIIKKLQNNFPIKIIEHKKNIGQSHCILSGIKESKYQTIITLDGDGQNNPLDIPKLLNIYNGNNYALVGGIRLNRKDNLIKIISSKLANKVRSYILDDDCLDTGCSLKVFDKKIFLNFPFFDGIHRFLPALYKGFGHTTFFVSVDHRPRLSGVSKYGILNRVFKGLIDIARVRKIINNYRKSKN